MTVFIHRLRQEKEVNGYGVSETWWVGLMACEMMD
jgi:hypothetical protein